MTRPLPPRPNLLQLKHQAKDLRKAQVAGDVDALAQIRRYLPRCAEFTEGEILKNGISLQEAQHVVACDYGFKHWEMLRAVVEADLDILAGLRDQEIQILLRVIDQEVFTRAIKGAGAVVVAARFLSNMSQRVRTFMLEGVEFMEALSEEESAEARRYILVKAAELAMQAQLVWPENKDAKQVEMEKAVAEANLDILAYLYDREAQHVMRQIDQKDMTTALMGAGSAVQDRFLLNMSSRVRGFLRAEMEMSKADSEHIEEARRKIVQLAAECAVRGEINWPDGTTLPPSERVEPQYQPSQQLHEIAARPLDQLNSNDLEDLFSSLSKQAHDQGILSLVEYADSIDDPFLRMGLQLAVDGCEPALIRDMLETRLGNAILPYQKTRGLMVLEGTMAVYSGDNPLIVRHKLAMFIAQPSPDWGDLDMADVGVDELLARLREKSVADMTLENLCDFYALAAKVARAETLSALKPLYEALGRERDLTSELARRGLQMMCDGVQADRVMQAIQTQLDAYLESSEKVHRMVVGGLCAIQEGKEPEDVAATVRGVGTQVAGA